MKLRRTRGSSIAVVLAALASVFSLGARAANPPITAYVIMGEGGYGVARVLTHAAECPALSVDGKVRAMTVRARAETIPQRATQSSAENSKPSVFPALTCEARLPLGARSASVLGQRLPLPKAIIRRIVVIGDTGCRLKVSDHAWQACNDPTKYPFANVASKAAAWKPDLVVHVGDLLYRENPCPMGNAGCAGSPWGYGLDAWRADFFDPASPLLRAAPWVVTRGNHETCSRAGQGWWRFIEPRPLAAGRDCNDPTNDVSGDYAMPYAVPLGAGAQIVVMDLANAGAKPIAMSDPRFDDLRQTYARLDALARRASFTFALDHYPILGVSTDSKTSAIRSGNAAVESVFQTLNPLILPQNVDVLLAGHVHLWEQVSFATDHPSQFVAGFSGTEEDVVPIPAHLPPGVEPAPGALITAFSSWLDGFGYMTLEKQGSRSWKVTVWNTGGEAVNHCTIVGRRSRCDIPQVVVQ